MENDNLDKLRHSAAHLIAGAVLELWPGTKPTIGPPIENGFYYDFDFGKVKISDTDLPKIEQKMHELVEKWVSFENLPESVADIKKRYAGNKYKLELIDEFEKENQEISLYKSGEFVDLCRGGHINNPSKELKYFKLLSVAGAYWRGDEKNKMLTRIYGTVFPTQKELNDHLEKLEIAKESDHRVIGKNLGLFVFSDLVGKGLPLLTEKGATMRRELERFIVDEEIKRNYQHVITPPIAKTDLYKTSGHYPYYKDTMYPVMKVDEEELILRPMTCPHHFMLYKSDIRSYKDLPIRYAEMASQHRYEKSGELSGLVRVRMFTLNDAHIFVEKEKAEDEIKNVLELIDYANDKLGLVKGIDYRYRLSLGDREDNKKYYKDDKAWDEAEAVLRKVLKESNAPYYEAENEAAFYGPKIDVQLKKVNEKEETAFTVQYDFVMPKRFDLRYIDNEGQEKQPIVIHRAAIGCIERTMAFLIEKYKGNFPVWFTPVQVKVLPITEKQVEYAQSIIDKLKKEDIRVELDDRNETLGAKIRDAQNEKVSYMLIVGEKEVNEKKVAVRLRSGEDLGQISFDEFYKRISEKIQHKSLDL
jgi:threonyl-tRNA synthetase